MKKTLIALMAISSSAFAITESVKRDALTDLGIQDDLLTAWDFTNNGLGLAAGKINGTLGGWTSTPITSETTDGKRYGTIGGTTAGGGWQTGMSSNFTNAAFTLSMDVNYMKADAGDVLADLGAGTGTNGSTHIYLATNNDGNVVVKLDDSVVITSTVNSSNLNWTTLTLTSGLANAGDTNQTLTLYVDGSKVGTADGWASDLKITATQFGGMLGSGDNKMNEMHLTNLALWKSALTSAQVAAFATPEPATATLSLLALAGLAARRRRK